MSEIMKIRSAVCIQDIEIVEDIVVSTNFFNKEEIDIAVELISDKFQKKENSSYKFLFLEQKGIVIGYSCYGHIYGTTKSYDLYWIVLHNDQRGKGFGKYLLEETEKIILQSGGKQVYVETSSKQQYLPTRYFYERMGYKKEAILENFYASNDDKLIYVKLL